MVRSPGEGARRNDRLAGIRQPPATEFKNPPPRVRIIPWGFLMRIFTFDTTLRDGTQGEGISFSVEDKLAIAQKLDEFGIDYIEGGWPGSNPKDEEFFQRARTSNFSHARLTAFGSTRLAKNPAYEDRNSLRSPRPALAPSPSSARPGTFTCGQRSESASGQKAAFTRRPRPGAGPWTPSIAPSGPASTASAPDLREPCLLDYKVRLLDSGGGTGGRVRVLVGWTDGRSSWSTAGVSDNVVEASWSALLDAVRLEVVRLRSGIGELAHEQG